MSDDRNTLRKLQSQVISMSILLDAVIEVLQTARGVPGVDFMPLEKAMTDIAFRNEKSSRINEGLPVEYRERLEKMFPEGAPEFMRGTGGKGTEDAGGV